MWDALKNASFKLFGKSLEPYVEYFSSIKTDLEMSNISLSLAEYVHVIIFVPFIIFVMEFPLLAFIFSFFAPVIVAFLLSFTVTVFISLVAFFLFYSYPSMISAKRRKNIDGALPFATTYLATVSGSRAPPATMFKVLSQFEEYGEVAKEAKKIYRDVSVFGMDLVAAMRKTASRTPSSQLKELLWGMSNVMSTGSDMPTFLREKSRNFMQEYRRSLEQFSEKLSMGIEIYLTVLIVGSIFFVIMSAVMSLFSSDLSLTLSFLQFVVIFVAMPVVSAGFIILLKEISPTML